MATETVTNPARAEILERIRRANHGGKDRARMDKAWEDIARGYRKDGSRDRESVLDLFESRVRDYDSGVVRVAAADVAQTVAGLLNGRSIRRMVIPRGLNRQWLPGGTEFLVDEGLTAAELDRIDGVMTGASLAIAETGTVVLQNVPGQGRRMMTLVPDYHLCIVEAQDVLETVPQAMARLESTAGVATTFVSGPSATADIEMTRIKGVHGPRFLDIVLVV